MWHKALARPLTAHGNLFMNSAIELPMAWPFELLLTSLIGAWHSRRCVCRLKILIINVIITQIFCKYNTKFTKDPNFYVSINYVVLIYSYKRGTINNLQIGCTCKIITTIISMRFITPVKWKLISTVNFHFTITLQLEPMTCQSTSRIYSMKQRYSSN